MQRAGAMSVCRGFNVLASTREAAVVKSVRVSYQAPHLSNHQPVRPPTPCPAADRVGEIVDYCDSDLSTSLGRNWTRLIQYFLGNVEKEWTILVRIKFRKLFRALEDRDQNISPFLG